MEVNPPKNQRETQLEVEYENLKKRQEIKFFKTLAGMLLFLIAYTIYLRVSWVNIIPVIALGSLWKFASRSKEDPKFLIFGFCAFSYIWVLYCFFDGKQRFFNHSADAFYIGCAFSMYEVIVIGRMSKFSHKIFFIMMALLTRFALIPSAVEITPFVMQTVMISFKLYLDCDKEKLDKELFRAYFNYKDQLAKFKDADAEKDSMLGTVSHELRTPLNGILGMIQVIEKKIYDQEVLHYLSICKSSGNLLLSLVNSILDLNQMRANKLKLYCEKIDVNKLLTSVMALFDFQCNQKGIYLKTRMSPSTPDFIYSDKNRLSQILINLVGNALKFTFKGGITLSAAVSEDGNSIQFVVEDTGIGIKAEDKEKLFKIFGRLDNEDEKINHQGVGLGLMISNNLAKLLCNKEELKGIRVESEFGKGSSFSFYVNKRHGSLKKEESFKANYGDESLEEGNISITDKLSSYSNKKKNNSKMSSPVKSDEENEEPRFLFKNVRPMLLPRLASSPEHFFKIRTEPNSAVSSSLFRPRIPECSPLILVVDDNPFNVTVAEHMLAALNFQVKSALSGDACVELLASHDHEEDPIKLILMDCQMPLMDGYETTRILRKKMKEKKIPEIPIVALTANDTELDKEECKKVGMCDYLSKPLNENKLKRVIKRYVE